MGKRKSLASATTVNSKRGKSSTSASIASGSSASPSASQSSSVAPLSTMMMTAAQVRELYQVACAGFRALEKKQQQQKKKKKKTKKPKKTLKPKKTKKQKKKSSKASRSPTTDESEDECDEEVMADDIAARERIAEVLQTMYRQVEMVAADEAKKIAAKSAAKAHIKASHSNKLAFKSKSKSKSNTRAESASPTILADRPSACQVCFADFESGGEDDSKESKDDDSSAQFKRIVCLNCQHGMICQQCFTKYLHLRIQDEDVLPWLRCPEPECTSYLHATDILNSVPSTKDIYALAAVYLRKVLARNSDWIECKNKDCKFGFLADLHVGKKLVCEVCGLKQTPKQKKEELDVEFKKMIAQGVMRDCPCCNHLTLKDYGICNVIQCPKCGIWWNWKTRETGTSSTALKNNARATGSLWEPGELAYQQRLERDNLPAFIELLARNGIAYDPSYVRGTFD